MSFAEPVLVVVGGGAAGLAAAVEAARWCPGRVLVLDQAPILSVGTCGLPYLIGGQIDQPQKLILNTPQQLQERGLQIRTQCRVESIDLANARLHIRDVGRGQVNSLPFQNLLLAVGAQADFPGAQFSNIIAPRDLESSLRARAWLRQPECRRVLVVGAGYLGLELSEAARFAGRDVTLVDPTPRLLGLQSGLEKRVLEELSGNGIEFRRARVQAWEGPGQTSRLARQAVLDDGQKVDFDLALLATGAKPSHPLLSALAVERGPLGGIRVDRQGRTSRRGVFGAGDACEIPGRNSSAPTYQPLARPAALLGQVAGACAVGQQRRFAGCLPCVAVKLFNLEIAWVGAPLIEKEEIYCRHCSTRSEYWPSAGWLDLCLQFDRPGGPLRLAQAVGTEGAAARIQTLAMAIEQGLNAEQVAQSDYPYTPTLSSLWDPIVRTVRAAKRWA